MNNLTKIAALPTGGGCQSALRPEDRGVERKAPAADDGYVMCKSTRGFKTITVQAQPGDQVEPVSLDPGEGVGIGVSPTLTLNFGGPPPQDFDIEKFKKDWTRAMAKGGAA